MRSLRRRLAVGGVCLGAAFGAWVWFGPLAEGVAVPTGSRQTLVVVDRYGVPLDPASGRLLTARERSTEEGAGPSLARRASRLAAATIAAEDQRYGRHPGVDVVALSRAAWHDVRARSVVEGGSTLTQQLVKLRLGRAGQRGGPMSKMREMTQAVRLDRRWSKDRILSAFLAEAPYGGRIVGAEDAARVYFDRPVSRLSWAQSAYLAALPQRPTRYNPRRNADAALERQRWILRRLRADGLISRAELDSALRERLDVGTTSERPIAPHFVEMVRTHASANESGPVRTTLDADLQRAVAGIASRQRRALTSNGASNVGVVVLDNRTGEVLAWEGSGDATDVRHGGALNGPLLKRQTGSTIKPFIYALAFDEGRAPGDLVEDRPFRRPGVDEDFTPENYDHRFRGVITMREALASSVNVPAVRLLSDIGPRKLVGLLSDADVAIDGGAARHGLALALGTGEMSLLDLTRLYATVARGGVNIRAQMILDDPRPPEEPARVISEAAAFLVADVLADDEARAPAFGRDSLLSFPFPVSAKTGTSQNFHDNWVVGFTPQFTVGVWVGNFDRRPLKGATGITGAGPLFHDVMRAAHDRLTPGWGIDRSIERSVPESLLVDDVCVDAACAVQRREYRWASSQTAVSASSGSSARVRMAEPRPGARYEIDPASPARLQRLPLRASGGRAPYRFTVDGDVVESDWPIEAGRHEVCVTDADVARACAQFEVRP